LKFTKLIFTILGVCFLILIGCEKEEDGQIVAAVGEEVLTLEELVDQIPLHIRSDVSPVVIREFVLRWINDEVLYREAMIKKLDEDPEIQKEFEMLKRDLLISRLIENTLSTKIEVTDEEIQAFYDANKEAFVLSEDIVRAYHILVQTNDEAREIRKRLRADEPFEEVAREFSPDSLSYDGYDLGYFTKEEVIPEIANVVFKVSDNTIPFPIKSDFGYHVVKVVDSQKSGEIKKFEIVKDEIKHKLLTKKKEDRYQRFLLQMKSKVNIQTNFQLLDSSVLDSVLHTGESITYE